MYIHGEWAGYNNVVPLGLWERERCNKLKDTSKLLG